MTDVKSDLYCSFCGKSEHEVRKLISGPSVHICDECSEMCHDLANNGIVDLEAQKNDSQSTLAAIPKPQEIYKQLDMHVVGQEFAKKILSVAAYNHYKRIDKCEDDEVDKSNILFVGPTGSGKTLLAETLAKLLDVPLAICDATTLTESGYVGEDVQNVIRKLVQKADGDISKAQRGIVVIDEIDKISRKSENPSITKDVGGEGVQQALLKLIEGTVVSVGNTARKNPDKEGTDVDTTNILFICSGSFDGIEKLISDRINTKSSSIGLQAQFNREEEKEKTNVLEYIEPDDLVKFGLIPEFVGRLPVVSHFNKIDKETLIRILTEPKKSIVNQYTKLFNIDNLELAFDEDALEEIADRALARKTGARGLRSIVESTLLETMFTIPGLDNAKKVTVTKGSVCKTESPKVDFN